MRIFIIFFLFFCFLIQYFDGYPRAFCLDRPWACEGIEIENSTQQAHDYKEKTKEGRPTNYVFNQDLCDCQVPKASNEYRIIDGYVVGRDTDFRFIASIFARKIGTNDKETFNFDNYITHCTATIINPTFLLSAAHCEEARTEKIYENTEFFAASGGDHSLRAIYRSEKYYRKIKKGYMHPNYTMVEMNAVNDIAVFEVEQPFVFGTQNNIWPACFMRFWLKDFGSTDLVHVGYGVTQKGIVEDKTSNWTGIFKFDPPNENLNYFKTKAYFYTPFKNGSCGIPDKPDEIFGKKICTKSEESTTCSGDSGSPVLVWKANRMAVVGVFYSGYPDIFAPRGETILNERNESFPLSCYPGEM